MRSLFKTFQSGGGDCVFFLLEEGKSRFVMMIDCGKYTTDIKNYVEHSLNKHIDLLIVTHIDNDHIDGLVEMLIETPDIKIDKILYNCNQLWDGQTDRQNLDKVNTDIELLRRNLPPRRVFEGEKIKADQAMTLAENLANNEQLWNAWEKEAYLTVDTPPIRLDENNERFGRLIVLSPTKRRIEKLNQKFKVEYARLTKHILDTGGNTKGQETLFELVERVAAMKRENYQIKEAEKTGTISSPYNDIQLKKAYEFKPKSITDENEASIALMWLSDNKKVLLMGDAEPGDVAERIKDIFGEEKQDVEVLKVSHHGSKHSTSIELLKLIDSEHYFITGGNRSDKPSLEAIMKIVNRGDDRTRTLHINQRNNNIVMALNSKEARSIREQYHFKIVYDNEYRFEY